MQFSRIPPPPTFPPDGGEGQPSGPMERAPLPPDRLKQRLAIGLCVSLLVNFAFYNQAGRWGRQIRTVFLRALHEQYAPGPAQIILVAPRHSAQPGGKTTYAPLAVPQSSPAASPSPLSRERERTPPQGR